jgi:hypothetical protein
MLLFCCVEPASWRQDGRKSARKAPGCGDKHLVPALAYPSMYDLRQRMIGVQHVGRTTAVKPKLMCKKHM